MGIEGRGIRLCGVWLDGTEGSETGDVGEVRV